MNLAPGTYIFFGLHITCYKTIMFGWVYEQMPQAWVWAHHISIFVRLLPDHRILTLFRPSLILWEQDWERARFQIGVSGLILLIMEGRLRHATVLPAFHWVRYINAYNCKPLLLHFRPPSCNNSYRKDLTGPACGNKMGVTSAWDLYSCFENINFLKFTLAQLL